MKALSHQLTGVALVYATAKAEGMEVSVVVADGTPEVWRDTGVSDYNGDDAFNNEDGEPRYFAENGVPVGVYGNPIEFSRGLAEAIIDREGISTLKRPDGEWWSCIGDPSDDETLGYGARDRREAAMRTWVVHKLGEVVDIPDVLARKDAGHTRTRRRDAAG